MTSLSNKSLQKPKNKKNQPCRFFFSTNNYCKYGDDCPYLHNTISSTNMSSSDVTLTMQDLLLSPSCSHTTTDRDITRFSKNEKFFERVATQSLEFKIQSRTNRCNRCWHDKKTHCICEYIPPLSESITSSLLPIKVIVLMHYKEYLSAGNDAKLLLAMLPSEFNQLFVFGKDGDWEKLEEECRMDPKHTILLWPSEDAYTIDEWAQSVLLEDSPWKQWMMTTTTLSSIRHADPSSISFPMNSKHSLPLLRVIVLDGVYSHARLMFRTMKRRLSNFMPPHIALHPTTVSIYHRAQKNYHTANYESTVRQSKDPNRMHICTVEAFALLCKELRDRTQEGVRKDGGEENTMVKEDALTEALVKAVRVNNMALVHSASVRPTNSNE